MTSAASPEGAARVLALSGSLRATSSNTEVLRALAALAPPGMEVTLFEGLGGLPHFNPDLEGREPAPVLDFRARLLACDGVVICSPEYAHGVPGVLKNALDWLVGSGELVDKPVALLNASPRSTHAFASLTEIVTVMSATVVPEASISLPLRGQKLDAAGIVAHPELADPLRAAMRVFARAMDARRRSDDGADARC